MISGIIAWYFLTILKTIRVLNRCCFYVIQKVCMYIDVALLKYISSDNAKVASNFLSDQQSTFSSTEFYSTAKPIKKATKKLSQKSLQLQHSCIQDNGNSSRSSNENSISEMQISSVTIGFNDTDKPITYNLNDANGHNAAYEDYQIKNFTKFPRRSEIVELENSAKSDTISSFCLTDSYKFTEETTSKPVLSDLSKSNEENHMERNENEMESNNDKHSSNTINSKSFNFPGFPKNTTLFLSENSHPSSDPDIKVYTSDPTIKVEFSISNTSSPGYCSKSLNKQNFGESSEFVTAIHSSEKNKKTSETGSFPTATTDTSFLPKPSPCPHSSGGCICHTCDDLVNELSVLSSCIGEMHSSNRSSEIKSNLMDPNVRDSKKETEKSLITHVKKVEEIEVDNASCLREPGQLKNLTKFPTSSEVVESENSHCFRKKSSDNLPGFIPECIASDENEMKYSNKYSSTRDGSAESLETSTASTELNQESTDSNLFRLSSEVDNLKTSLVSEILQYETLTKQVLKGIFDLTKDSNEKHKEISEAIRQYDENTPLRDIYNSLHSVLTFEHPETSMVDSNRTEITEDNAQNLIKKDQEPHNQLNKSDERLTEISDADDKQIKLANTLEKDSENANSKLEETNNTENERIVQDFPRNKKLRQKTCIAGNKKCKSSKESPKCNESEKGLSSTALCKMNYSKSSDNASKLSPHTKDYGTVLHKKIQSNRPSIIYLRPDLSLPSRKDEMKTATEHRRLEVQDFGNEDDTNKKLNKERSKGLKNRELSNEQSCSSSSNLDERKLRSQTDEVSRNKKSKKSNKKSKQN